MSAFPRIIATMLAEDAQVFSNERLFGFFWRRVVAYCAENAARAYPRLIPAAFFVDTDRKLALVLAWSRKIIPVGRLFEIADGVISGVAVLVVEHIARPRSMLQKPNDVRAQIRCAADIDDKSGILAVFRFRERSDTSEYFAGFRVMPKLVFDAFKDTVGGLANIMFSHMGSLRKFHREVIVK